MHSAMLLVIACDLCMAITSSLCYPLVLLRSWIVRTRAFQWGGKFKLQPETPTPIGRSLFQLSLFHFWPSFLLMWAGRNPLWFYMGSYHSWAQLDGFPVFWVWPDQFMALLGISRIDHVMKTSLSHSLSLSCIMNVWEEWVWDSAFQINQTSEKLRVWRTWNMIH